MVGWIRVAALGWALTVSSPITYCHYRRHHHRHHHRYHHCYLHRHRHQRWIRAVAQRWAPIRPHAHLGRTIIVTVIVIIIINDKVDQSRSSEMSSDSSARSPWTGVSQFLPTTQKLLQVSHIDDTGNADIQSPSSFPTAKAPSPARRLFMLPALLTFSTSATSTSLKKFASFNLGSSSKKIVLFRNTSQVYFFSSCFYFWEQGTLQKLPYFGIPKLTWWI